MILVALAIIVAASAGCSRVAAAGSLCQLYSAEQISNARAIVESATNMHLGDQAALLGLTAALGESDLENLPFGDGAINPDGSPSDSVGLFQQQHWWGSYEARMDPRLAARSFFERLKEIPDWRSVAPTTAIHDVQCNADGNYYTQFVRPAQALLLNLATQQTSGPTIDPASVTIDVSPDYESLHDILANELAEVLSASR